MLFSVRVNINIIQNLAAHQRYEERSIKGGVWALFTVVLSVPKAQRHEEDAAVRRVIYSEEEHRLG